MVKAPPFGGRFSLASADRPKAISVVSEKNSITIGLAHQKRPDEEGHGSIRRSFRLHTDINFIRQYKCFSALSQDSRNLFQMGVATIAQSNALDHQLTCTIEFLFTT